LLKKNNLIAFFIISNVYAKRFSSEILNLILNIPIASSLEELEKIFYTLEQSEESKVKGILLFVFYLLVSLLY